ncbi:hypothetical protein RvY_00070 [Ramazzottius varieornatus]|uniref:Uncharacterized protein n=1 Tax=Ramazzottius varieornatus TaxID=947166 RepID=A0A1D1UF71_RAMVA|nr:hypothetical protein RvY_00070 [Ramazzottius varieornatus]
MLTLFKPEKWTSVNDFEAAAFVLFQLSLVGHTDYQRVKILAHPYCVREHWSELMTAVSEVHGTLWMHTLDRLVGEEHAEQREDFAKELLSRIKYALQHPMINMELWESGTNFNNDQDDVDKCQPEPPVQPQHNQPESSVLVSFLEQAFEFFQHNSQGDFARICHSMLKLVPTDQQAAFNSHHLVMFAEMFDKQTDSDRGVAHSLATVLAGLLYADDVDKLACAGNFGPKLIRFLDKHLQAPDLLCMLATALSQIPLYMSRVGCLTQQLTDVPALFRCAFAHFWEWPTLMPLVMCILQAVSTMPVTDVARTPLVPLLMLTIHCHVDFPCEINLALRMLRRLIQKSDLGACMVIRFPVGGALYSPVDTFLRILELHGNKNSLRREIALITVRLWSTERFFAILMQDGWLKIFAALMSASRQQKGITKLLKQCLADRNLVIIDNKIYRISKEPFIKSAEYFDS